MRRLRMWALTMALLAGTAHAGVSGTVTATSDYDFRGISQSATDVALQGSFDWAHDSGFFLGAWASNVDFSSPGADFGEEVEVDLYTGFSQSFESGASWNAGFVYYLYPGAEYPGTSYQTRLLGSVARRRLQEFRRQVLVLGRLRQFRGRERHVGRGLVSRGQLHDQLAARLRHRLARGPWSD